MSDVAPFILASLDDGDSVCVATVTASDNARWPVGWKRVHCRTDDEHGGGSPQDPIRRAALAALDVGRSACVRVLPDVEVFLDVVSPDPQLLVCGAGHIALPLARMGLELGFRVTVLDDRDDFATRDRFPNCEILASDFQVALRQHRVGPQTFAVVRSGRGLGRGRTLRASDRCLRLTFRGWARRVDRSGA